jgi:hypothetical protein
MNVNIEKLKLRNNRPDGSKKVYKRYYLNNRP